MTHSDEQAELWALGALMEYDAAALLGAHPLTPEDFTSPERSLAFRAVESLAQAGKPVTFDGVVLTLRLTGGPRVAELLRAASGAIDAKGWGPERFGVVAAELWRLRTCRAVVTNLRDRLADLEKPGADPLAVGAAAQEFVAGLGAAAVDVDRTGADDLLELADDWANADERPVRISTGIPTLDEHLGGGYVLNINIVAGEPGALKSGLCATTAWNQLRAGVPVGYVGVEEGTKFLGKRLIADRMGMRVADVGRARLNPYQQETLSGEMGKVFPILQGLRVDSTATDPRRLMQVVRRWIQQGVRVIYIDHLGELQHQQTVRDRFDLAIRNTLLQLRPLVIGKVALVVVAHLNRGSEGGRPKKHHLKESGYIEAMGRLVLGCWKHERWPDRVLVEVVKGNEVETDTTLWLKAKWQAALVDSDEGGRIDWSDVERERREQQHAKAGGWQRKGSFNGAGQD